MIDHTKLEGHVSDWVPEDDPIVLAVIAKVVEECGELVAIIGRIQAQGLDGSDPDTGVPNIRALAEEIADVRAMTDLVITRLMLPVVDISNRSDAKLRHKLAWIKRLERALQEVHQ